MAGKSINKPKPGEVGCAAWSLLGREALVTRCVWEQGGGAVGLQTWWQTQSGPDQIGAAWTAPSSSGCSPADAASQGCSGNIPGSWDGGTGTAGSSAVSVLQLGPVCLHNRLRGWDCSRDVFLPVFLCGWNLVDRNPQVGKGNECLGQRECAKLGTDTEPRPQPGYKLPPCKAILAFAVFSLVINLLGTGGVSPRMP